jgi:hypothetical protein
MVGQPFSIQDLQLCDGLRSSPGPWERKSLCCSYSSGAEVKYHERQTRCVRSRSMAGSSEKTVMRNSEMLKARCVAEDTLGGLFWVPGSGMVRKSERASVDTVDVGNTTLK